MKELEVGSKEIDAIKGVLRGSMCIGSLPLYGSKLIYKWIDDFNASHPQVYVKIKSGASEDIESGVIAGNIDMGLSFQPQQTDLTVQELFTDEIVLVASKNHAVSARKEIVVDDIQSLELALPSERISTVRIMLRYFEQVKIQANVGLSFDDGHALIEFVKAGRYVTCLPKRVVSSEPELCTFPLPGQRMPVSFCAMWTQLTPSTKVFLQILSEKAKHLPPLG